jgi:hypothetical protein
MGISSGEDIEIGGHGGSIPPACQGWQRAIRRMPSHAPRRAPYFSTAPIM